MHIREIESLGAFKKHVKRHVLRLAFNILIFLLLLLIFSKFHSGLGIYISFLSSLFPNFDHFMLNGAIVSLSITIITIIIIIIIIII